MLSKDAEVFVQFPAESESRILHPAVIADVEEGVFTVRLKESCQTPQQGAAAIIFYEQKREFMQQPGRIEVLFEEDDTTTLAVQPIGEPTSAESRQTYRATTLSANLQASVNDEPGHSIQDVSASGLAIQSKTSFALGDVVDIAVEFEGEKYTGQATVQSVAIISETRFRYGLRVIDDRKNAGNLPRGLQRISAAIQRRQLRRLSGAA